MALADTLIMATLAIGGGYILIYHVLPGMQTGNFGGGGGGGSFLPPVAATTGAHRCWEIGDGTRACSCNGKQHTVMGKARTCPDCISYCNTGILPPVGSVSPSTPAATGHRCWVVNPTTNQRACACAGKQHTVMGANRTCPDCITYCNTGRLPDAKKPTSAPTPPRQTNPTGGGTWECKVTATGTTGRRWVCINRATRQSVIQAPGWSCTGKLATNFPVGYPCAIAR